MSGLPKITKTKRRYGKTYKKGESYYTGVDANDAARHRIDRGQKTFISRCQGKNRKGEKEIRYVVYYRP